MNTVFTFLRFGHCLGIFHLIHRPLQLVEQERCGCCFPRNTLR
nr:MAG TPA: hypothetical protein [Caudoviricetes sp.]